MESPKAVVRVNELDELLNQCLTYTQSLVAELSPSMLQGFGLPMGLRWLAEQMQRHDLHVDVQMEQEDLPLPEEQAVLLFQSVRELLMNVIKHAKTARAVVSLAATPDGAVRLTVQDDGCGFESAASEQGSRDSSQFGLFSIRERMEALGGWLELVSAPGRGTQATLVLPSVLAVSPRLTVEPPALVPAGTAPMPHRDGPGPVQVLLVDDHTLFRQGLRSLLETQLQGKVIGEASDGQEAVLLARTLKPDVVLMDINMPKMDGIEATRRIKQEQPGIIVIGLSFHNSGTVEETMRAAGAAAFISKDAAAEQLCRTIEAVVRGSGASSNPA